MIQFRLCNPTEILFFAGQISTLSQLVSPGTRVLLLYGGGSTKRNGIYDKAMAPCAIASSRICRHRSEPRL